jgi:hypothetical protein
MPRCRPFKLIDAMILIAAAAGWMAMSRSLWGQFRKVGTEPYLLPVRNPNLQDSYGVPWYIYAGFVHAGLENAVVMLSLGYLAIRLVPPRPPRLDLIRQPGMLSFGLVLLVMALPWCGPVEILILFVASVLSWIAACLVYRSRAEPGWIEGLGRSVGVGWLAYIANVYALYALAS